MLFPRKESFIPGKVLAVNGLNAVVSCSMLRGKKVMLYYQIQWRKINDISSGLTKNQKESEMI
jgi:hypothetical protein